jgi:hypothetical protein
VCSGPRLNGGSQHLSGRIEPRVRSGLGAAEGLRHFGHRQILDFVQDENSALIVIEQGEQAQEIEVRAVVGRSDADLGDLRAQLLAPVPRLAPVVGGWEERSASRLPARDGALPPKCGQLPKSANKSSMTSRFSGKTRKSRDSS